MVVILLLSGRVVHPVCREPTHIATYLNANSRHHPFYKLSVVNALDYPVIVMSQTKILQPKNNLQRTVQNNGYKERIHNKFKERYKVICNQENNSQLIFVSGISKVLAICQSSKVRCRRTSSRNRTSYILPTANLLSSDLYIMFKKITEMKDIARRSFNINRDSDYPLPCM